MNAHVTDPEQLSAQQYADALQLLSDRITDKQWDMLRAHYHALDRAVTARQLAKEVGYPNYGSVNLQYGRLGGLLGSVLGLGDRNSSMIATFVEPGARGNPEWLWVMLPQMATALEQLGRVGFSAHGIDVGQIIEGSERALSLEELAAMADKLPWVSANVFIMPPHQYVVEKKLQSQEERDAFKTLSDSCAHHPKRWKAFFRAYKTKGSYLELGEYRYWYSQIGAARMINRSDRKIELENIRGSAGDRAVNNWSGCAYAWRREYGLECENIHCYCNLVVVEAGDGSPSFSIVRYAAMVSLDAVSGWSASSRNNALSKMVEDEIRSLLSGIEAVDGVRAAYSKHVTCSDEEVSLRAVWMQQKDMAVSRVATDLRWFSTAPKLVVERVFPLGTGRDYLVQLSVPPI